LHGGGCDECPRSSSTTYLPVWFTTARCHHATGRGKGSQRVRRGGRTRSLGVVATLSKMKKRFHVSHDRSTGLTSPTRTKTDGKVIVLGAADVCGCCVTHVRCPTMAPALANVHPGHTRRIHASLEASHTPRKSGSLFPSVSHLLRCVSA
jgi:hypothetical protein